MRLRSSSQSPRYSQRSTPTRRNTRTLPESVEGSEEEGELTSPSSVSSASRLRHPARTNNAGLPLHVQKQLLQDIENARGISFSYDLKRICDQRQEIYGEPGTERRRQVRNKVQHWRGLERGAYVEILFNLPFQPSGARLSVTPPEPVLSSST